MLISLYWLGWFAYCVYWIYGLGFFCWFACVGWFALWCWFSVSDGFERVLSLYVIVSVGCLVLYLVALLLLIFGGLLFDLLVVLRWCLLWCLKFQFGLSLGVDSWLFLLVYLCVLLLVLFWWFVAGLGFVGDLLVVVCGLDDCCACFLCWWLC